MSGTVRRVGHLLLHNRKLLVEKARARVIRRIGYFGEVHRALRSQPAKDARPHGDVLSILGESSPIVIVERRSGFTRCGLPARRLPSLLSAIWRIFPDATTSVTHPNKGLVALLSAYGLSYFNATFPAAAPRHVFQFDLYDPSGGGSFVNRNGRDKVAAVLYGDVFPRESGLVDLTSCLPQLVRRTNELDIDIVYTWVDSRDADWRMAFDSIDKSKVGSDAMSGSRFHSNDELRYSLRSVYDNLPWARNIHIVSNCRPPEWLDTEHPNIHWVTHESILPADCLPTFNSHAIEASLHRIPGLSENFLYFNDDVFVLRRMLPSDFVNDNGTLNANLEAQAVVNAPPSDDSPDYLNAARNSAQLLFDRFGYYPTRLHRHSPFSLRRSLLDELEAEFPASIAATRKARFRSLTDINVPTFLAHHYGFAKQAVAYTSYSTSLVKSSDPFSLLRIADMAKRRLRPRVLCINEGGKPEPSEHWRRQVSRFLADTLPNRAPWESSGP